MDTDFYDRMLEWFSGLGIWLSVAALLTVFMGCLGMSLLLRHERRGKTWKTAVLAGTLALAANLADFYVTFYRSPDLYLELNPVWRNVIDKWGITTAWWYGFCGKVLLSVLAGLMAAFYIKHRERLYPDRAIDFFAFIRRMGERSKDWRDRLSGLFTIFCFFFAWIQLFGFYIAYLNWQVNSMSRQQMPPVLLALASVLLGIGAVFLVFTYRAFKKHIRSEDSSE